MTLFSIYFLGQALYLCCCHHPYCCQGLLKGTTEATVYAGIARPAPLIFRMTPFLPWCHTHSISPYHLTECKSLEISPK